MKTKYFLILASLFLGFISVNGQDKTSKVDEQPKVLKAVAPTFFPFVMEQTGVNEALVRVTINNEGKVTAAKMINVTVGWDATFEIAAKKWLFESSPNKEERTAEIKFILRLMPKGTDESDLAAIYTYPAQIEIRREVYGPLFQPHPGPKYPPIQTKKPSQTRSKKKRN
jgi:hypothetical protein